MPTERIHAEHREHAARLLRAVLETPGDTPVSLRRAVEARAAALGGGSGMPSSVALPAPIDGYVDRVALHAYQITDADIDTLGSAGLSEDAIFEITLSAATGAARGRLDRGLAALRGARHETQSR